jgi:hypothetical protein
MTSPASCIVVAGAGPAGLIAAIAAARGGARVTVLERMPRPGLKLLTTGGGHCNLTSDLPIDAFIEAYGRHGRFANDALREFGPAALRAFMAELGVPTLVNPPPLVYPRSGRARDVLEALLNGARSAGVEVVCGEALEAIEVSGGAVRAIRTGRRSLPCDRLVVATGGLSYSKLGGCDRGLKAVEQAGLALAPPLPALVPLVVRETWPGTLAGISLSGIRVCAHVRPRAELTGDILFTHRGLSGPAALNLSGRVAAALADGGEPVRLTLDLLGGDALEVLTGWRTAHGARTVAHCLAEHLPRALADALCREAGLPEGVRANALRRDHAAELARLLNACPVTVTGTEGFDHAMVTQGGVSLRQVDPRTLQSRAVSGLFLAGEVLDIDGPCGGFNLQWAFASGHLAGTSAASPS